MGSTPSKAAVAPKPDFPPQPPYDGTPVEYHHVKMLATLDIGHAAYGLNQPDVTIDSINIESYLPTLESTYQQGYRMSAFFSTPDQSSSQGIAARGHYHITAQFQGTFRKPFPEEMGQEWELKIEKALLVIQIVYEHSGNIFSGTSSNGGYAADSSHVVQTLDRVGEMGGRLISIEMTGLAGREMQLAILMNQRKLLLHYRRTNTFPPLHFSVDVFYEIPRHGSGEKYTYKVVSVPMDSSYKQNFSRRGLHSVIDWQTVMTQYLDCGWKLVEIFDDKSSSSSVQNHSISAATLQSRRNCQFIFEKPRSRLNDNTPYYEGTMMETFVTCSTVTHFGGCLGTEYNVTTRHEPLINHMGDYGWQVVRIVGTPDTIKRRRYVVDTRQLIFFQRKRAGRY